MKKYIQDENPSFWESNGKDVFDKLNDQEIDLLLDLYENKKSFDQAVSDLAYKVDPKKAKQIEDEYREKIVKADEQYYREVEKIELEEDEALDRIDREDMESLAKMEGEVKKLTTDLVDTQKYEKVKAKLKE